jgi:hypothetical protein
MPILKMNPSHGSISGCLTTPLGHHGTMDNMYEPSKGLLGNFPFVAQDHKLTWPISEILYPTM